MTSGNPTVPTDPAPPRAVADREAPPAPVTSSRLLGGRGLRPVSGRLVPVRYLSALVGDVIALVLIAGAVVLWAMVGWWWPLLVAVIPLVLVLQALVLTPRRVRALGYLDREEDIVVAHGIMFRTITVTPYGRIQSVEIDEGPIERAFGLASLRFTTASSAAGGSIPGLPRAEAERLRELLTRRGIERMQSL